MKEHAPLRTGLCAIGVLCLLSAIGASGARPSAPRYTFTDLGTPSHGAFNLHGFNNNGQIVGEAVPDGASAFNGFVWQAGRVTWLPSLGGERSFGAAINNRGEIIGTAESAPGADAMEAVEWKDGKPVDLTDALPPGSDIGLLYINDQGRIVGRGIVDGHPSVCLLTRQQAALPIPDCARVGDKAERNFSRTADSGA